jgi:hypothetical protein
VDGSRAAAVTLALIGWMGSALAALIGLYAGLIRCDESCTGESWRRSRGGWQWDVVLGLGLGTFPFGTVLVVAVASRSRRGAGFALVGGLGCASGLATIVAADVARSGTGLVLAIATVGAAIGAVGMTPTRRR